jgi:phospholipid/cholesterol/gamma-HCH transport system permease protein
MESLGGEDAGSAGAAPPEFEVRARDDRTAVLRLKGSWTMKHVLPGLSRELRRFQAENDVTCLVVDIQELTDWDSRLVSLLLRLREACAEENIEFQTDNLSQGLRRLLDMAVKGAKAPAGRKEASGLLSWEVLSSRLSSFYSGLLDFLDFLGESVKATAVFFFGFACFRKRDLVHLVRECGVDALPIVTLINLLVGLILAFAGAIQLENFGAQIYVADLVTISMTREMGAIMTGIIMAGRTGAAFAAHLGTMTVNEEIDALQTFGFSPIEFLVVPRIIALVFMMPLLYLYAVIMGMLGGIAVGVGMLDLTFAQYINETQLVFTYTNLGLGLFKSAVFGLLIALAGCYRGLKSGRSAASVGLAATSSVVAAIVAIIACDGLFAVLCDILGI